jgi:ribosomal protein L11 methylase PrmA
VHAKTQKHYAKQGDLRKKIPKLSRAGFIGIMNSLERAVKGLKWNPRDSEWSDYYLNTNYTSEAFEEKGEIVRKFLLRSNPRTVWDVGANTGRFSRLASDNGIETIAFDVDPAAVEKNYISVKLNKEDNILPLVSDLTNPSPGIGWQNTERASLIERGPADTLIALALVHHLVISNNLSFSKIANFMQTVCEWLIIEFVPKRDSQVQRLLSTRKDIFSDYTQETFEKDFGKYFVIREREKIRYSDRILYLMQKV